VIRRRPALFLVDVAAALGPPPAHLVPTLFQVVLLDVLLVLHRRQQGRLVDDRGQSAPENIGVPRANRLRSTFGPSLIFRACTFRIS